MSNERADVERDARSFVDRVLESQRRHGHESQVTPEDYERAVERAAAAMVKLTERRETSDEEEAVTV